MLKPHFREALLLLSLAVLASLAGRWPGIERPETALSPPTISVDGVRLGDNLDQVQARWGRVDRFPGPQGGHFVLPRSSRVRDGRPGQYAELDAQGKVAAVTGEVLQVGGSDITLRRGDYPARALHALGRPLRRSRVAGWIRDDQVCWTFRKSGVLIDVVVPEGFDRRSEQGLGRPDASLRISEITIAYPPRVKPQ